MTLEELSSKLSDLTTSIALSERDIKALFKKLDSIQEEQEASKGRHTYMLKSLNDTHEGLFSHMKAEEAWQKFIIILGSISLGIFSWGLLTLISVQDNMNSHIESDGARQIYTDSRLDKLEELK